ncbi:MAG: hypothetical protein LBF16_12535 [Pseudomonadales bacterium]|nr:hypothetical protein [Pseudomonadales bacterium]
MIRFICLVIVGIGMMFYGWGFHGKTLAPDAPERAGALFKMFGQQGLVVGALSIGFLLFIIGVWGNLHIFRKLQSSGKKDGHQ